MLSPLPRWRPSPPAGMPRACSKEKHNRTILSALSTAFNLALTPSVSRHHPKAHFTDEGLATEALLPRFPMSSPASGHKTSAALARGGHSQSQNNGTFVSFLPFRLPRPSSLPGCLITTVLSKTSAVFYTKAATFPAISSP